MLFFFPFFSLLPWNQDDDELECDALCKEKILHRVLRNVHSQLLVVRPDLNVAAFEDVTDQEMQSGKGMHFSIHCYKTTTPLAGMPVAFSVQVENKSYYMCCEREGGEMIVRFKVRICIPLLTCTNQLRAGIKLLRACAGINLFPFTFLRKEKFPKKFLVKATSSFSKRHLHLAPPGHLSLNIHWNEGCSWPLSKKAT
uniref:Interleukin-18 n=1 Tax=Ficedula albicollis TaxID=59894 RepID=A0A803WD81_FICAL